MFEYFQKNWVYCDEDSLDPNVPNKRKRKYKLMFSKHPFLSEVLIFFISTKDFESCKPEFTIIVEENEWECKREQYLKKISYIDVSKPLFENVDILLNKYLKKIILCVAKLPEQKYIKIFENFQKLKKYNFDNKDRMDKKNLICQILDKNPKDYISNELLKKLGL